MNSTKSNLESGDEAVSAYVKLIRTAEQLHAEVSRGLSAEGLTASQFSTLKVLRMKGPLPQKSIASYLLRTGGNITVVVDNLEREKLVVRERDTQDRRQVYVRLTEEGAALFDRLYPAHLERIRQAMQGIVAEELSDFTQQLNRLSESCAEPICKSVKKSLSRAEITV